MSAARVVAQYTALLASLDAMAALPGEPCPACGSNADHYRCTKCNVCKSVHVGVGRYEGSRVVCGCGVKATCYHDPMRPQTARKPFAATFSAELVGKIRRGWAPSEKQVALAQKLAKETARGPAAPVTTAERDAVDFLTDRMRAWKSVLPFLAREAPEVVAAFAEKDGRLTRESVAAARAAVRRVLADKTGWDRFPTVAEWHDAGRVTGVRKTGPRGGDLGPVDPVLAAAVAALTEQHAFVVREKWVVEAAPAVRAA